LKRTRKKVPLPLKRVRKALPPPARVLQDKKKYNRERAQKESQRIIRESTPGLPTKSLR